MNAYQKSLPPNTTPMDGTMWSIRCHVATTDIEELHQLLCAENLYSQGLLLQAGFKLLSWCEHSFTPEGHTRLDLLAESHFAWHTFPETGWTYIEITSCIEQKRDQLLKLFRADPERFCGIETGTKTAPPPRIPLSQEAR